MKTYKIKAIRFPTEPATENSLFIIQEIKKEFSIYEDPYGDYESGEQPLFSELNYVNGTETKFKSLEEIKEILVDNGMTDELYEFVDLED